MPQDRESYYYQRAQSSQGNYSFIGWIILVIVIFIALMFTPGIISSLSKGIKDLRIADGITTVVGGVATGVTDIVGGVFGTVGSTIKDLTTYATDQGFSVWDRVVDKADFTKGNFWPALDFTSADWGNLDFTKADWSMFDFTAPDWSQFDFTKNASDLDFTKNIDQLDVTKADYSKIDVSQADWEKLDVTKADWSNIDPTRLF